ncbi:hypothetical protein KA050_00810 [Candidatus Gracilibacteria bacterium]|nr:hypothetical protein [Candidatus Gracilibacteria bacterium]
MTEATPEPRPLTPGVGDLDFFARDPEGNGLPDSDGPHAVTRIYGDKATEVVDGRLPVAP